MKYYLIAPAKTFHSSDNLLTYSSETPFKIGQIVEIPLGRQSTIGIVVKNTTQPDFDTKSITKIIYEQPLPKKLVDALFWLSSYYRCPLSTVIQAALPRGITKNRRGKLPEAPNITPIDNPLNSAQRAAIRAIEENPANTILLHGITGSGKTNIYIELCARTLAKNQSVILLVPEIALTSQLVRNFQQHFKNITLLHSNLTESLRHQLWEKILTDNQPQVIIGPRSALFAPVQDLGLIIIDEAHEPAYHQEQNPKYSASLLAGKLAKTVLGTATPLISDYYLCKSHNAIVEVNQLAIESDKHTSISVIDLKNRSDFTKSRILSNQLIDSIKASLANHTQSMLFHNRRGTAPMTICDKCGWQALCPNCFLPLVLHADAFQMRCHTCARNFPVPTACPECKNASIHHKGFGTKLIEDELHRLFPSAKIARFDMDTDDDLKLTKIYDEVYRGDYNIIVGTQMIAKGFDFPRLTTLGIVQADAGLSLPDFSSEERTFQLITQVIGRAKRGHQNSNIFIQSFQPDHPIISLASQSDYASFYNYLVQKRQQSKLPPYSFLLKLSVTYKTETATVKNIRTLYKKVIQTTKQLQIPASRIVVSPPMPAFHERTSTGYTWQLIIKAKSRQNLLDIFDHLPKNNYLHYDFDPISLL
ncbi:MAG: primosomal protein N' [bacterium]|nr:primosomal protein N' [bacterium]